MIKKLYLFIILLLFTILPSHAHEFSEEAMKYILSNNSVSSSNFEGYVFDLDDQELITNLRNKETRVPTLLLIPEKGYIINFVEKNPDYTYKQIERQIENDGFLNELGMESLWEFLQEFYPNENKPPVGSFSLTHFKDTIIFGIKHILGGADHILFIITLIICFPKTRRVLLLITTFTLSHSLTILLGGFQVVTLSSSIVEGMIVFSIIIMGVYALFQKVETSKKLIIEIIIIFILGLFHGLGFAGFFSSVIGEGQNILLPVLAFNIGVELGQLFIIAIIYAFLFLTYKKLFPGKKDIIKNIFCGFIILYAGYLLYGQFI